MVAATSSWPWLTLGGLGLFAFTPLVLFLLLKLPLGPGVSLLLALGLMVGHRRVAAPWVARHGGRRCLWCGRAGEPAEVFRVESRDRDWELGACRRAHGLQAARFLNHVRKHRLLIALGIFLPLFALVLGTASAALGHGWVEQGRLALFFRTVVALTVLLTSLTYFAASTSEPLSSPFPLHNLCLLGIAKTLWVFRIVGTGWLLMSVASFLSV